MRAERELALAVLFHRTDAFHQFRKDISAPSWLLLLEPAQTEIDQAFDLGNGKRRKTLA